MKKQKKSSRLDSHKLNLLELEELFGKVFDTYPDYQKLEKAYVFAKKAHMGQTRGGGKPYISHPLRMTIGLFKEFSVKALVVLQAALLHDVVEDTDVNIGGIEERFGEKVAELVKHLTRPRIPNEDKRPNAKFEAKKRKFAKQLKAPYEVRILKSVDLLDNMRDWLFIPKDDPLISKFPRWLYEAELFYIPLAESVGPRYITAMREVINEMAARGHKAKTGGFAA